MKEVPVKVSSESLGWPGRVGMEQELLCEHSEDRAAEQSCCRGKNEQVWGDPSKIQALGRSFSSSDRSVVMEKPPLGCHKAANAEGWRLGKGDPSRQGEFGTPPEQHGHCHGSPCCCQQFVPQAFSWPRFIDNS